MDPRGPFDWSEYTIELASSGQIGPWSLWLPAALIAIVVIRLIVKRWRWTLWIRRIFWVAHMVIVPAAIYALIYILGVTLEVTEGGDVALWLKRGGDAVLTIALAMLVVEGLDIFVWKGIARKKFGQATPAILIGASAVLVYLTAAYLIATVVFDIPITGALVSSGIVLGVIGLSLQSTIGDVFAGIFISLERPFRIGDWIVTEDGKLGKVIEIDWRATRLLSFNHSVFVVPNSKIANSVIENRAEPEPKYGYYFYVHIAPEAPIGLVRRVLLEAVLSSPFVLSDPPPNVYLYRGNKRPYEFLVYVYFETFEMSWPGNADIQARIHDYLRRAGIPVAGESREVRHRRMDAPPTEEPSIAQLLGEIPLFLSLTPEELDHLSEGVRTTRYRPGDVIMREGDAGDSLLVITAGLAHVTRKKAYGREITVNRLGMGQCIGEMSLLTGRPRSATVRAVTDCEIVEIPKDGMAELFEKRPDLVDDLARTMAERRAASELISDRDAAVAHRLSLQDIADRFGGRIRRFFR